MDYADRDTFNYLAERRRQLLDMRSYVLINDSDNGVAICAREPAPGGGRYTVGEPVISAKVTNIQNFLLTLVNTQISANEASFLSIGCTVTDQEGIT